jgi:hypothetical protein
VSGQSQQISGLDGEFQRRGQLLNGKLYLMAMDRWGNTM